MNRKLKITVYAITKDEARFVDRWMDSMKEADAVVVLDTGSRDNTVELLKARGAIVNRKVYTTWATLDEYREIEKSGRTPWRFDWSRNDSIDFAVKSVPDTDILVCTDLDEILLPGWREKLENAAVECLEKNGKLPTTFKYEYVWNFRPDGSDGTKFTYEKIHTVAANARWTHPVHEILSYPDGTKSDVYVPGIRLEHHADPSKSRAQYLNLLELSVAESPMDDRNMHYLGREYMFRRRWDDAIATLQRHLRLPTARWDAERAASMRYIARCYDAKGMTDHAKLWFYRAMLEAPHQREAAYELAEMLHAHIDPEPEKREWYEIIKACEICLSVRNREMSYLTSPEAWGARPWDLYSVALWWTGRHTEAIAANKNAMALDPNDQRLKDNDALMRKLVAGKDAS